MSSIARRLFSSRPLRSGKLTFTRYLSKCCQLFRSHPKPNTLNWQVKSTVVKTPVFRSEAEEAEWWDRHQDLIADLLLKHGRRGAVPTKSVSVRLPITDIARARKLAEKRGVGYQTVIKTLLHEALKKESKIA